MTDLLRLERLAAPLFVVLWSTGFIGARLGLPHIEPMTFLAIRFALVVGVLWVWMRLSDARPLTWAQARDAALIGVLMHSIYLGGVFIAIDLGLEAGVAALIVGLQPVLTAFLAGQVLGDKLRGAQWLGMALGFGGVALVVARKLGEGIGDWRGVGFCAAGLLAICLASILQKTRAGDHPLRAAAMVQFAAAAVTSALAALIFETGSIRWTGDLVFAMAWLVLVLSVGAVSLLLILIRRGAAAEVASLFFLVPASTALIAWALFGEVMGPVELAGIAVAAFGVLLVNRPKPAP
ncbi:MAG: DMT family transporter [Pseudomonadota bacterium]